MAKLNEISNLQLVKQIEKYEKIMDKLFAERQKRLDSGEGPEELYTRREKLEASQLGKSFDKQTGTFDYNLKLSDTEVKEINALNEEREEVHEPQTELVRMTQILRLSKKQIDEFNQASEQYREDKKKVGPKQKPQDPEIIKNLIDKDEE